MCVRTDRVSTNIGTANGLRGRFEEHVLYFGYGAWPMCSMRKDYAFVSVCVYICAVFPLSSQQLSHIGPEAEVYCANNNTNCASHYITLNAVIFKEMCEMKYSKMSLVSFAFLQSLQ